MIDPLESHAVLYLWLGFLLLMAAAVACCFVWAIRSRQFANQDRARYLALESRIPDAEPKREDGEGRGDTT